MDNTNLLARLLMGQGHGEPAPVPNSSMADALMNETLIRREPGQELNVRARVGSPNVMLDALAPDRHMSAMDRFNWVSTPSGGLSLAANLLGAGRAPVRSLKEIDKALTRALKGSPDWHPMDTAMRSSEELKSMGFPAKALPLAEERRAAVEALDKQLAAVDGRLNTLLKGTDIDVMDVALRGPQGLAQIKRLIPPESYDEVVSLAAQRQKLTD